MSARFAARTALLPCLFSALVLQASPAMAVENPFHIEAGIGRVSVDELGDIGIDESSNYFRLGAGYRLRPWLGISGSFVNLGTIDSRVAINGGAPIAVKASADGFELAMTGHIAVTDALSLRAEAGVLRWQGDTSVGGVEAHDRGRDSTWGVGAEYQFSERFTLTLGWRRYVIDDVDADTTWVGLKVSFGDTQ